MIVVASTNGSVGIQESMRVLKAGGSALDAVEAGIRLVESNAQDSSVGLGGLPNFLGEVELDASIMDGNSLSAGAVGALKGYEHPISVARKVMEKLPHVFLVGAGAARFAGEMCFDRADLLTEASRGVWEKGLKETVPAEVFENLETRTDLWKWVERSADPERPWGTVNFIAQDQAGDICTGVSTSGWAWKYPGRLGDSPVIGAGNYAHNRYGAAACTGMGEMAIRCSTARSVVLYMKMGMSVVEAGRTAMEDLNELGGKYLDRMNLIALDRNGQPAAFSSAEGVTYTYMTGEMQEPVVEMRTTVPLRAAWARR